MSLHFLLLLTCILRNNKVAGSDMFKTKYGDIYDCVGFYKQPSLNHPMLRNQSFHHLMRPSFLSRNAYGSTPGNNTKRRKAGCPEGTVPIRRISQDDSKIDSFVTVTEPSGTYVAGVRTKPGSTRYSGGGMIVSVYNPHTMPGAYSQARMRISSGPDSIQVGWRVDPSLRGDNLTRTFIYTETSSSRCFDAQCGFVIVNTSLPLDSYIAPVSKPGGPIYQFKFDIIRDSTTGNWWLQCGSHNNNVGFWPKSIFTALGDLATDVDWAGEVYSAAGVAEPLMGSGYKPEVGTTRYVAYFLMIKVLDENNTYIDADNVEEFATDRTLYDVSDEGNVGGEFGHLALFGGARY